MTKCFALGALLFSFSVSSAFAGYACEGEGIKVSLTNYEQTLIVERGSLVRIYPVTETSSRTGHSDQTYLTAEGVALTIDDELGDSLKFGGREYSLSCRSI